MAFAHVQTVEGNNASGSTVAAAALTLVGAGDAIPVRVKWEGDAATVGLTDTIGNTYTLVGTQFNDSNYRMAHGYILSSGAGALNVVTADLGASRTNLNIIVGQYTGISAFLASGFCAGGTLVGGPGTGANAIATENLDVTSQPALLWGTCIDLEGGTITAGTSPNTFTSRGTITNGIAEDARITATGNTTATMTAGFGSHTFMPAAMAFSEAAAGVTRTPTVGALALAGLAATVAMTGNVSVTPTVAALTLSGNAPTVSVSGSVSITPAAGSLTLTGLQPVQDLTVAAPVTGALTLSGNAPTLLSGTVVSASVGSLSISGLAPTVAQSGPVNTTITVSTGSMTLTGNAAALILSSPLIRPTTGALTLTGNAPGAVSQASTTGHKAPVRQGGMMVFG